MNSDIALESLIQRGRTLLFNDLVSLYQNSQDALRDNPRASGKDINITLKSIGFIENIKSIIKQHVNIVISKVIILEALHPNAMAIIDQPKSKIAAIENKTATYGMIMQKINNLYDDKNAYLNTNQVKLDFVFKLALTTSFWSIRNKDKSYYFTPEEVAAITLHEIGHFDHWIRTFNRVSSKIIDASEIVTYLETSPEKEVVLEIINQTRKTKFLDKSWNGILDTTEKYFQKTNSFDSQEYIEAVNIVSTIVTAGVSRYTLSKFNLIENTYFRPKNIGSSSIGLKDHILDTERSADEFAARNGAYKDLSKGLLKFTDLYENNYKLLTAQRGLYKQYLFITSLKTFQSVFSYYAEDILVGYDPLLRRVELIIETAKHAFSDITLPEDTKIEIANQIKESEAYLKAYKSSHRNNLRDTFKTWQKSIDKFGRIIKSPFENRTRGDYDKLQESTRHLSRNPLHYIAKS